MTRVSIFSIAAALLIATAIVGGMVSCSDGSNNSNDNGNEGEFYSLTIASTIGGHVSDPGEGNFTYLRGTVISLAATSHGGYHFVDWTGNVSTVGNVSKAATSINISGEYSIMANFEVDPPAQYMLAIMGTPGGLVTVPGEGAFIYDPGAVVNIVAKPASGYEFSKWSGDVDGIADVNAASTTITMSGNYSYILICANFRERPPVCGGVRY